MNPNDPPPVRIFIETSATLVGAVDRAMREPQKLPGLILLYTSIDIFAALTRPIDQPDTSGPVFKDWIDRYMLPYPPLRCTSTDLWGACCGLLHTFSTESKKSREGHARELHYVGDDRAADELQKVDHGCVEHVVVGIPSLMRAFVGGMANFSLALKTDAMLRSQAEHHLKKFVLADVITADEIARITKHDSGG